MRGRWFDPFGYSRERKLEHEHRDQVISWILELSKAREEKKVDAILDLILSIRGYGHVKEKNLRLFKPQIVALIAEISHENKEQKISLNSLPIFS